jgi:hypothetical protein
MGSLDSNKRPIKLPSMPTLVESINATEDNKVSKYACDNNSNVNIECQESDNCRANKSRSFYNAVKVKDICYSNQYQQIETHAKKRLSYANDNIDKDKRRFTMDDQKNNTHSAKYCRNINKISCVSQKCNSSTFTKRKSIDNILNFYSLCSDYSEKVFSSVKRIVMLLPIIMLCLSLLPGMHI